MPHRTRQHQNGLSLIELMISITLGLLLSTGVIQMFMSSKQVYTTQEALGRIQENARFAMAAIKAPLRDIGGFDFCPGVVLIANQLNTLGPGYSAIIFDPNQPIHGWEYQNTAPAPASPTYALAGDPLVAAGSATAGQWQDDTGLPLDANFFTINSKILAGSDVVVVKTAVEMGGLTACNNNLNAVNNEPLNINFPAACPGGTPPASPFTPARMAALLPPQSLVYITNCRGQTDFFQRTDAAVSTATTLSRATGGPGPGNATSLWSIGWAGDAVVSKVNVLAFYVGVGTSGEPALMQLDFGRGGIGATPRELVEGVENMQVLYGQSSPTALNYVTAANVTDWNSVFSVQLAVLVRSKGQADAVADNQTYSVGGTNVTPGGADRRMRRSFVITVGVRDRISGRSI